MLILSTKQWAGHVLQCLIVMSILLPWTANTHAQEDTAVEPGADEKAYISATDLLPGSVAGLLRIPNLPELSSGWEKTNI